MKKDCGNISVKRPPKFSNEEFQTWMSSQGFTKIFSRSKTFAKVVAGRFAIKNKIDTGEILEALELASKLGKNYFEMQKVRLEGGSNGKSRNILFIMLNKNPCFFINSFFVC